MTSAFWRKFLRRSLVIGTVWIFYLLPVAIAQAPQIYYQDYLNTFVNNNPSYFYNLEKNNSNSLPSPLPFFYNYQNGALQLDVQNSQLFGYSFLGKITQKIGNKNAFSLDWESGQKENRINGTWGFKLGSHQLIKLTAESLSEKLFFNFDSGGIQKNIPQNAYGIEYNYFFPSHRLADIDVGFYYANANSDSLPTVNFISQSSEYNNFRHIAGATSEGGNIGIDLQLWKSNLTSLKVNYDSVNYHPLYSLQNIEKNNSEVGCTINFDQLITKQIKLNLSASKRAIYDDYSAAISWMIPTLSCNHLELQVSGESIISHNNTPNNLNYSAGINYSWGSNTCNAVARYPLPTLAKKDLVNWTKVPAVYMHQVLAASDQMTQKIVLTLFSIFPNQGPNIGGTAFTISGQGFVPGTLIFFDGLLIPVGIVVNETTIHGITPAHSSGPVDIEVVNPNGNHFKLPHAFTFDPDVPAPNIQNVNPNLGSSQGGDLITISGNGFIQANKTYPEILSVTFGEVPATNISVINSTTITCMTPVHDPGVVNVTVTTPTGSNTLVNGFTFFAAPNISNISPNTGSIAGGTSVTISGTGFTGTTAVTFGGNPANNISVINDTTITCTTPAHAEGIVNVVVTNPVGSHTFNNGFTYFNEPNINNINPNTGSTTGGTSVTISGSGFTGTTAVTFDGNSASNISVINDTTITCTTPPHAAGAVNVTITNPAGNNTLNNGFTYFTEPNIDNVSPNVGSTAGGTSVTISGSGFTGTTAVTFGGNSVSNISVINDSTIICITSAHAAGSVNIVVTNSAGSNTLNNGFTYFAEPTIDNVNPNIGSTVGGTSVTISGSGFTGTTAVTFGGNSASNVSVINDTTITCITPAHAAGTVNLVVINPVGSSTLNNGFTYFTEPNINNVNPNTGSTTGGTSVTISGNGFTGTTAVTFGGNSASNISVINDTTITCTTPAHAAGAVNIVVTNPAGNNTLNNGFTYFSEPNIDSINPNIGSTAGDTSVTISGSGFTGTTAVTFGGNSASNISVINDTTITCTTPTHTAGVVNVVVTNPAGSNTLINGFTYFAEPDIDSINPNVGTTAGGTAVTISGSGFTGTTAVTFGGNSASNISVVNDTTITCTTPVHAAGVVNIVVTNPVGSNTFNNGFTYFAEPDIDSINPNVGSTAGGTSVTISGSGFTGVTAVTFGGNAASNISIVNDTTITCTTPAHAAGAVNIVVTNPAGNHTLNNGFTYYTTPNINNVNPNAGSTAGGTAVTISGSGFTGTTAVTFGGNSASNISVINDTTITCTTPAHAAGAVNIVVTNPAGSNTLTNGFTYFVAPDLVSANPITGAIAGGTSVTLSGTGFTGTTAVTFDGNSASNISVVNDTTITCTTPAHAAGAVNIVVTNPAGSDTLTNGFTYVATPNITSVVPNVGLSVGLLPVTINGSNFLGATSVRFGGTAATMVIVVSNNVITCLTPAHSLGAVNVTVTGPGGTGTLTNGFTYVLIERDSMKK